MTQSTWTIKTSPTRLREEWKCALCGAMFISEETLADLFDEQGEHQGVVCPACVATGPEAAEVRLALRQPRQVRIEMPAPLVHGASAQWIARPFHLHLSDGAGCLLGVAGAR